MEICKRVKSKCRRCDIGYVIKDHIRAILQILSNELEEYYMQLITTKCLNTAVTMMYLLIGNKGLVHTRYCDVDNVIKRYSNASKSVNDYIKMRWDIGRKMIKSILTTSFTYRYVYYIMLTDGWMYKGKEKLYFPGHVFIIEKLPKQSADTPQEYALYQSYIAQYDMKGAIQRNGGSIRISYTKMMNLLSGMASFLQKSTWDQESIDFWKELTYVNVSEYSGFDSKSIALCYQKVLVKDCSTILRKIVDNRIRRIKYELTMSPEISEHIYGDDTKYSKMDVDPLTYKQMLEELVTMKKKLG